MGTYRCKMKGCVGSGSFTMEQGEEEWHMQKFGHLPTNCPDCRAFKKSVTDIDITCTACEFTFTVTAQQIIGWHIHNGIWERPTLCKLCEEDPNRKVRKTLSRAAYAVAKKFYDGKADHPRQHLLRPVEKRWFRRNAKRKVANARAYLESWVKAVAMNRSGDGLKSTIGLKDLSSKWGTSRVEIATDVNFYKSLPDSIHGTRFNHLINKHYEAGDLDALGAKNPDQVFEKLFEVTTNVSPSVVDLRDTKEGYLVKYDTDKGIVVIIHDKQRTKRDRSGKVIGIEQPPPPPAYVVTSYNPSLRQVGRKLAGDSNRSNWVPDIVS